MKNLNLVGKIAAVVALEVAGGCGGNDTGLGPDYVCTSCAAAPEASPDDDGLPSGVYKGIVVQVDEVRSLSGSLKAVIATDESTGNVELTVNGTTRTSTDYARHAPPIGGINANGVTDPGDTLYSFDGDTFAFDLTVSALGQVVESSLEWDGASVRTVVVKELSSQLVECFQGTWSGVVGASDDISGVWNFVTAGGDLSGAYDSDFFGGSGAFVGTFEGNHGEFFDEGGDTLASGDRTNDYIDGSWEEPSYHASGTWSGARQR